MSKRDLVELQCDFCNAYDTIDVREPAEKVLPIITKWCGVMDGDQAPNQADSHRWYDTFDCMVAGEKRYRNHKAESQQRQAEQDRILTKANEELKRSPYMTDKAVPAGKA